MLEIVIRLAETPDGDLDFEGELEGCDATETEKEIGQRLYDLMKRALFGEEEREE